MDIKQKILSLIKIRGPVIPSKISKEIGSDILIASAHLSELSSKGEVRVSSLKVGGTPLYFLAGQETQLEKFSDNLSEKPKKAYELLKQEKVLRDSAVEPVIRVALREIKDFAVPLQVTYLDKKEIFWRFHTVGKEEAHEKIKSFFSENSKEEIKPKEELVKEDTKKEQKETTTKEEEQKTLKEQSAPEKEVKQLPKKEKPKEDFFSEIKAFLSEKNVNILDSEVLRKNSEINLVIEVPSNLGNLKYYCKAKNKKKINDTDLSAAYALGQIKKLPVMFLTKGEPLKKAKELLDKDFDSINFVNIE